MPGVKLYVMSVNLYMDRVQGSKAEKMCVLGHMEFQNRVGRFFFYFFLFYMGMIGKQYVRTGKSLGIP